MIPKIIHFFHNKDVFSSSKCLGDRICIDSWYQYCPDFEIRHWHQESPDLLNLLLQSRFLRDCYKYKIWPMVADYFRAWLLYTYGGIYFDSDVQLSKRLDPLLSEKLFIAAFKTQWNAYLFEPAMFGAKINHPYLEQILALYNSDYLYHDEISIGPCIYTELFSKIYRQDPELSWSLEGLSGTPGSGTAVYFPKLPQGQIYRTRDGLMSVIPENILSSPWDVNKHRSQELIAVHWGIRGPISWANPQATKFLHHKHRKFPHLYRGYAYIKETTRRLLHKPWQFVKKLLKGRHGVKK